MLARFWISVLMFSSAKLLFESISISKPQSLGLSAPFVNISYSSSLLSSMALLVNIAAMISFTMVVLPVPGAPLTA